jgi:thioesterase domain-containing protein
MVAFEMARQLQQQGERVSLLVLLDPDPLNPDPEPSSGEENPLSRSSLITTFRKKLNHHWRELAPLGPQEKVSYLLVRIKNRITALGHELCWLGWKALCETFNHPLPLALRTRYLASIYQPAARAYTPKSYRGRVILFKTEGRYRDGELGWGKQIAERLEIQELDADHDSVFKEPYVQIFAEKLQAHLSETKQMAYR